MTVVGLLVARRATRAALLCASSLLAVPAALADTASDPHAHHHMSGGETSRTLVATVVPDVELVREDGKAVRLPQELSDGRPVVLTFIYTSCTTICPLITSTLSQLQRKLGSARQRVHLVSISIDPEFDTPSRLRAYAKRFNAGPEWQHYTGTLAASQTVQRAFNAYRGDKMSHTPVTLVRTHPGEPWVRFDGFATADQLLAELPALQAAR